MNSNDRRYGVLRFTLYAQLSAASRAPIATTDTEA